MMISGIPPMMHKQIVTAVPATAAHEPFLSNNSEAKNRAGNRISALRCGILRNMMKYPLSIKAIAAKSDAVWSKKSLVKKKVRMPAKNSLAMMKTL